MAEATVNKTAGVMVFVRALQIPDIQVAFGLIGIIMTMIIPLPPVILDTFLAMSITFSFMILLVAIYVKQPLEFSTFPTILLMTTLFRLSLNVATTRSILLDAPSGNVSAIVKSFGDFVVGGNYFVGFVIFVILVIINFIVITKGAGRVAEVGARFTLDAMPGKQMAIDAELNNQMITPKEARQRRQNIEREADFYGSMDGASKFVRGDAIAGIIITAINIVVGLILGVTSYGMSFQESGKIFTLLTVGDGLVSQIPALVISTAAGIVVTRSGAGKDGSDLSSTLVNQIWGHPKALYLCSGLLIFVGIVPGLPIVPFWTLALISGLAGRSSSKRIAKTALNEQEKAQEQKPKDGSTQSIESLLHIDILAIEVGFGLIPLVDANQDGEVLQRIISSRKQFAENYGIIVPMVMVRDNIHLKPGEYQIMLKGNAVGSGNLMPDYLLAMDPGNVITHVEGIPGKEPAYDLKGLWIRKSQENEATINGYTVVNCSTIVVTHLSKIVEEHAEELIGRQEVQNIIDDLRETHPKVVEEVVGPDLLVLGDVVKVVQNLLREKVSIRDRLTIFETLADYCRKVTHPDALTRYVRIALGRNIVRTYLDHENRLSVLNLDRAIEDILANGIVSNDDGSTSLQVDPDILHKILHEILGKLNVFEETGSQPIILCSALVRWDLKNLLTKFAPILTVLATDEVPPQTKVNSLGIIQIG